MNEVEPAPGRFRSLPQAREAGAARPSAGIVEAWTIVGHLGEDLAPGDLDGQALTLASGMAVRVVEALLGEAIETDLGRLSELGGQAADSVRDRCPCLRLVAFDRLRDDAHRVERA